MRDGEQDEAAARVNDLDAYVFVIARGALCGGEDLGDVGQGDAGHGGTGEVNVVQGDAVGNGQAVGDVTEEQSEASATIRHNAQGNAVEAGVGLAHRVVGAI